jgi:YidC/Oxa1 family membrane protein insertase
MTKKAKGLLKVGALGLFVFLMAGCTANFCSEADKAHIMYAYENGVTVEGATVTLGDNLKIIVDDATADGYQVPSEDFWVRIDEKVHDKAAERATAEGFVYSTEAQLLEKYGYLKFLGTDDVLWGYWDSWVNELKFELGPEDCPDTDFTTAYKKAVNATYSSFRACIALSDGYYGPEDNYFLTGKSWSYAFDKGLIEGLLVYPVAWLVDSLSVSFGSSTAAMSGWAQLLAILLTTVIVRGLLMALTFKSTLGTQKMSMLQPELAKLQAKYPNSNTNQNDKQRLAQEQMELYKKNGINPFSQILVMLFQFPIFIAVWGAMTGSAVLATGSVFGLNLNASVGNSMITNFFSSAWWTAVILFIAMAVAQFVSMKLPTWMQKKAAKDVTHLAKNPAADSQQKQMKMISNVMLIMIIVMGFSLPSAMGVYWFVGALISMAQTLITKKVMAIKK